MCKVMDKTMDKGMNSEKSRIYITGIGMGAVETLTIEVEKAIKECDCIIGAKRMLEALSPFEKEEYATYQAEEMLAYIRQHKEHQQIVIALSGDVGFYSGAKRVLELLQPLAEYEVVVLPGISSVVYLAAKLEKTWEDAELISLHGKNHNLIHTVVHNKKTFVLLGDGEMGVSVCKKLKYYGLQDLTVSIGKRLSYEDERIFTKTVEQLRVEDLDDLTVIYIENQQPDLSVAKHLADDVFIRGEVPMTKEEIRTVNIAKLQLQKESVVYDVGAGTGSVAVEAAMQDASIKVYAIEKNPKGTALIKENKLKFKVDNLEIIEGRAPDVLQELPAPTHVFIGGSSGKLKEIIITVKRKNPNVRFVINAISLETIAEIMSCVEDGIITDPELVQMSVAKSQTLGSHHLMMGQNPIYIISC